MSKVRGLIVVFACIGGMQATAALAQNPPTPERPAWLQAKIAEYQRLPPFIPPRSISMTTREGKTTYTVSSACCDIPSELYDADGHLICYPDGGFAGGDGRCPAIVAGRPASVLVWRDERGR